MSHAKRCNSQDIFLSGETKEARTFDVTRREGSGKGGLRSWGGQEDTGGLRGWGGGSGYEDDGYYGSDKGKGKKGGSFRWEDGFAAGWAAANGGKGKGKGKGKGGGYGRDSYGGDRSRSPAARWGHDLWASDRGGSSKGWKGSSKGFGSSGGWGVSEKDDIYANFGTSKGGKNGKGGRGGYKGGGKGKKGRGKDRGSDEGEAPDPSKLDADLDRYFGKESAPSAAKDKGGKESATELDSQLNDYFGDGKSGGNVSKAEKKSEETKAGEEKKDEKMEEAKPEGKAEEAATAA